ncbi:hypothetical protein LL295_02680 [Vibrio campbellii]|uniref:hypothetical protein n=1 Tax=Vibrio campbellii TaxID=680 RepID=UPI001D1704CA|nr:hypothetical protein [Vibrio campbellii]MCC4222415.1 hypothetical protein [Vibrio campbellii]
MAIKSIWVKAPFVEKGYWDKQQVQVGSEIKEVPKGLLRKKQTEEVPVFEEQDVWVCTSHSDKQIDGERFNKIIEETVLKLDMEGFDIISITPVISGQYDYGDSVRNVNIDVVKSYGYGFSYTEGVTILAKST